MKKVLTVAVIIACFAAMHGGAQDDNVYSVNVAAFKQITVPGKQLNLASTPFDSEPATLESVFGGQLQGGDSFNTADQVIMFDPASGTYKDYFKADGTGLPEYDGKWFTADLQPATNQIVYPGVGFWIRSSVLSTQRVVFAGVLNTDISKTNTIVAGLQLISYPYNAPVYLHELALTNAASGGDSYNDLTADNIMLWDVQTQSYSNYFFADGTGMPEYDKKWLTPELQVATNVVIQPGQAFWYRHKGTGFTWVESRPYTLPTD